MKCEYEQKQFIVLHSIILEKVKNWYTYNESKNNKIVHCDLGKLIFATTNSISFERESDRQMFLWFWVMPSIGDLM